MGSDGDFILVLTTCPDEPSAAVLAQRLVEGGLAACVNILPVMQSVYMWKGILQSGREHQLFIKTRRDRYSAVEQVVMTGHPYELPEIIAVPISAGLPAYLAWINDIAKNP